RCACAPPVTSSASTPRVTVGFNTEGLRSGFYDSHDTAHAGCADARTRAASSREAHIVAGAVARSNGAWPKVVFDLATHGRQIVRSGKIRREAQLNFAARGIEVQHGITRCGSGKNDFT